MHEPHTPDEDFPPTGRHAAAPLDLRRTLLRLSAGIGALLVVAAVAVLTAFWTGLTGAAPPPVEQVQPPRPPAVAAGPTFARTLDLDAARADRAARPPATQAPTVVAESSDPPPAAETAPAPAPQPAPPPPPAPSVAPPPAPPVVQPGDPCSSEGAHGTTAAGKPVTCSARGGQGETRWRPA